MSIDGYRAVLNLKHPVNGLKASNKTFTIGFLVPSYPAEEYIDLRRLISGLLPMYSMGDATLDKKRMHAEFVGHGLFFLALLMFC